jgi:hypothetical protein
MKDSCLSDGPFGYERDVESRSAAGGVVGVVARFAAPCHWTNTTQTRRGPRGATVRNCLDVVVALEPSLASCAVGCDDALGLI